MKKAIIIFILLIITFFAYTEEKTIYDRYPIAVGIYFHFVSWSPLLQYQQYISDIGFQIGAIFFSSANTYDTYNYAAEITGSYRIFSIDWSNWFSSALYGLLDISNWGRYYYSYGENAYRFSSSLSGGIGMGVDIVFFEHFSLALELGYGISSFSLMTGSLNIGLITGVGLRYRI